MPFNASQFLAILNYNEVETRFSDRFSNYQALAAIQSSQSKATDIAVIPDPVIEQFKKGIQSVTTVLPNMSAPVVSNILTCTFPTNTGDTVTVPFSTGTYTSGFWIAPEVMNSYNVIDASKALRNQATITLNAIVAQIESDFLTYAKFAAAGNTPYLAAIANRSGSGVTNVGNQLRFLNQQNFVSDLRVAAEATKIAAPYGVTVINSLPVFNVANRLLNNGFPNLLSAWQMMGGQNQLTTNVATVPTLITPNRSLMANGNLEFFSTTSDIIAGQSAGIEGEGLFFPNGSLGLRSWLPNQYTRIAQASNGLMTIGGLPAGIDMGFFNLPELGLQVGFITRDTELCPATDFPGATNYDQAVHTSKIEVKFVVNVVFGKAYAGALQAAPVIEFQLA